VADRIDVRHGDARELPLDDATCDVIVSNFVLHDVDSRADRERMPREMVRVLKPGGHLALVDFIFMGEAVHTLRALGLRDSRRARAVPAMARWTSGPRRSSRLA
jgi:ubiquinone/menaquinone biosynthesis C-methylase UbiE